MSLQGLLLQKRAAIAAAWFERLLATYPPDTAKFLRREPNQFANPVGQTIAPALEKLLTALLEGAEEAQLREPLDSIVRIRAVQDFTAAEAVGFVLVLKELVHAELGGDKPPPLDNGRRLADELRHLEARIDRLVLLAFDIYTECREQLNRIRARELRLRTERLLERSNYVVSDEEAPPAPEVDR